MLLAHRVPLRASESFQPHLQLGNVAHAALSRRLLRHLKFWRVLCSHRQASAILHRADQPGSLPLFSQLLLAFQVGEVGDVVRQLNPEHGLN